MKTTYTIYGFETKKEGWFLVSRRPSKNAASVTLNACKALYPNWKFKVVRNGPKPKKTAQRSK